MDTMQFDVGKTKVGQSAVVITAKNKHNFKGLTYPKCMITMSTENCASLKPGNVFSAVKNAYAIIDCSPLLL